MPTFLDAAGVEYPGQPALPGRSLLGKPGGGLAEPRDYAFVDEGQGNNRWWSAMRGPWKYSYYTQGGWEELFNLDDDPQEIQNLLLGNVSPDARALADEMKGRLAEYERTAGFPSSFGPDGELRRAEVQPRRGGEGRAGYAAGRATNAQFPTWVGNLPPDEQARMESPGQSVMNAIRREWTYSLKDLNLAYYKSVGGSLEGVPEQAILDEIEL
jgi:hypothetical protein